MMAYDRAITELNTHRISGAPFPLIGALSEVATSLDDDVGPFSLFYCSHSR